MPGRPFEKGKSGNPGGRPKVEPEVRELAKALTLKAIGTLEKCLSDKQGKVRVMAAEALLSRGWGRPVQAVEHLLPAGAVEIRIMGVDGE